MSNQLTITDANLVFDTITTMPVAEAIDTIEYIKTVAKKLTSTAKELETYFGSKDIDGVVSGTNYELVTKQSSGESSTYNPQNVFDILKNIDVELAKEFLTRIKVTKKDVTDFAKSKELKLKVLEPALVAEFKEPTISYKLQIIK
jgi:hypothetical protein